MTAQLPDLASKKNKDLEKAKQLLLGRLRRERIVCLSRVRLSNPVKEGLLKEAADQLVKLGRARWDGSLEGVLHYEG